MQQMKTFSKMSMRKMAALKSLFLMALVVAAVCASSPTQAQQYSGTLNGSVSDSTGAKVPGAEVAATDTTTHFVTKGVTNGVGEYTIPFLAPDVYSITVTAKGFRAETSTGITLTAGGIVGTDFSLTVGNQGDSVLVVANTQLLDTESAELATTIPNEEVADLPNNGRNPNVMSTLTVGVYNSGSGGYFQGKSSQYTNPFSGTAIQISTDGSGGHNRLTLDGIPNDPPERLSGTTYAGFTPSPEAVQEVKVAQSIFDAQVGHGNGTVTDVIVKSGTNSFHGAAYLAFQDTYINANTSEKSHLEQNRNNDQLNQSGFVLDGPVRIPHLYDGRDKTHFMVAFERYASHTAVNYSSRVPTTAELTGDFSGLCNSFNGAGLCTSGIQLYVPNSPLDANNNRTQYFPNNNIASALSSAGTALAAYYPAANVAGASAQTSPNYVSTKTSYPSKYPSLIFRVDQQIGANDKFNAVYLQAGLTQNYPLQGFPKGVGPGGYGYNVYRNTRGGSADEVHTFSPNFVLDSRFGLEYHPFGLVYPGSQNFNLSNVGISATGLPYNSFPGVSPGDGYASLAAGAGGQISESTVGSLNEIATKIIKTHSIRFGVEGNLLRYNVQNPESGFGNFNFDRRFTQQNVITTSVGNDPNSGDSLADVLLGDFSSTSYNIQAAYALQQIYIAPWVQDDWRVTPKLTLNLGLRWDLESPYTERYNKLVTTFCTTCANPLQASVPGLPLNGGLEYTNGSDRNPYPANYKAIQPRIGAAYQLAPSTVIRGGWGIIYFNTFESPIGTGFTQSTSYNNYVAGNLPVNPLSNPFPNGVLAPTGSSLGLSTALGQSVTFVDPTHVQPRSTEYTLNVQHQFRGHLVVQAGYVGTRPTHLEVNHNINILPAQYYNQGAAEVGILNASVANPMAGMIPQSTTLNAAKIAQNLLYLPYPEFGSVTENYSPIGYAPYNALQIQVTKPMEHRFTVSGNLTWMKLMNHTAYLDNFAAVNGTLEHVQDPSPNFFGSIYGTYQFPSFESRPLYQREALGGWKLNGVMRFSDGSLLSAPGSIDIIGNYKQPGWSLHRQFNTCYNSVAIVNNQVVYTQVNSKQDSSGTYNTLTACDATSPTPAFQQRLQYTSQNNSTVLNIRQQLHPLVDLSLFKQFAIREGVNLEIRGEFFNVFNTPEWGAPPNSGTPNTSTLGVSNSGSSSSSYSVTNPTGIFVQANDARIGQLTARINF
jgi:hypothetical protein